MSVGFVSLDNAIYLFMISGINFFNIPTFVPPPNVVDPIRLYVNIPITLPDSLHIGLPELPTNDGISANKVFGALLLI